MPRIALIHALPESVDPAIDAFATQWPEARVFSVMDDSLATDRSAEGTLSARMFDRFLVLGRYAAEATDGQQRTSGILFTCSAFGPAIDAVKRALDMPVLRPNEAAFEEALALGPRIGIVVSFEPSLSSLIEELQGMAQAIGREISVCGVIAHGALDALKAGDTARHDGLVASAVAKMTDVDVVVLGQFSLARARKECEAATRLQVITTPGSAVAKLKRLTEESGKRCDHRSDVASA